METMKLECKLGTLVCSVFSDNSDYQEFAIDIVRPDGKAYSVLLVGTSALNGRVHTFLYDGDSDDYQLKYEMVPDGDGWFTDDYEQFVNASR